jgi:cytochrome c oxidase assembly protein subunit 15
LPRRLRPATVAYIEWPMSTRMSAAEAADFAGPRPAGRDMTAIRRWLYLVALLIVAMVVVGGATRLTHSGLSITEWQPIHGVVPPLNQAEWQEEFAKYRQIPEYRIENPDMTLAEFKGIFWWEWAHRILGRLIGVAVLLPMIGFFLAGRIDRQLAPKLIAIFILGGLQGAIGWWMVASGLADRTDVSQYRLATHLTFACVILAYVLWVARGLGRAPDGVANRGATTVGALLVALVLLQIALGGLVAGLDAGMTFNTWPLMDGALVPSGLFGLDPAWRNLFENVATVQFDHRLVAYTLLLVAIAHAVQMRGTAFAGRAGALAGLVLIQAALGIATLLTVVPLPLALAHQLGAVAVLSLAAVHLRELTMRPQIAAGLARV